MKKNVGSTDRAVRIALAVLVGALYLIGVIGGTLAIVLGSVGAIFIATSFVSFCPLYAIFNINTCKIKDNVPD